MIKDPLEVEVQLENVVLKDAKDMLEVRVELEHGEKGVKGDTGGVGQHVSTR